MKVDKETYYTPVKNGEKGIEENEQNVKLPLIGVRHWQVLLLFIMVFTAFGFRMILSVAIVAMTDPNASTNPNVPVYDWKDKGSILSAFFWGYIWPQVFAGYAANRFGAKWFLIGTMFVQSLLGISTPLTAAYLGSAGMCMSRALQGVCQGFIFPSVTHQLSQWVPHEERSRLGAFAFGAGPFGTVIAMLISGQIASSWYGWPLIFYIYGGVGLAWCLLFTVSGSNSPAVHPTISKAEKFYIEQSLGHTDEKPSHKVPWISIFKSVPVWAIFVVQLGNNYSMWTLMTQIPNYMSHVMNFNIKDNSTLSALPFLTLWIMSFMFSFTSDSIINKKMVTIGTSRKIFNTIGLVVPAIALIALGFTRSDQPAQGVILLIVAVSFNSACMSGWGLNHMDLSPNHAGTLMGLTNGLSHIAAIIAPLTVQYLVRDEEDPKEWRVIFLLAASLWMLVAVAFIGFGSGEVQPWNEDSEEEKKEKA
ncbi:unnamed protein product [Ceutorhynchus assimilis]|uniref:Putative inorganic phosphate cotransporter n=1 Tax=Ceutorhynchus assimilis TaxID=467358 RepID=A0A9N9QEY7_9CUCU|nr:unnamed protein product [Ceutorhynchus assimilis]